jgi:hypothetical protein
MGILHSKVSTKADGADASLVRASDWNASHVSPPFMYPLFAGAWIGTPPAVVAEVGDGYARTKIDLSQFSDVHLVAAVPDAGATGCVLTMQYSADGTNWSNGPQVAVGTSGVRVGYKYTLSGVGDVFVRLVTTGGDDLADLSLGNVFLREGGAAAPGEAGFLSSEYRGVGAMGSASNVNMLVNIRNDVVAGDLLVAFFGVPAANTVTPAAGWTEILVNNYLRAYYKIAGASEPASYTFVQSAAAWYTSICHAYANSAAAVVDVYSTNFNAAYAASQVIPAVTTTDADVLLIAAVAGAGTRTFTESSGVTAERFDSNANPCLATYDNIQAVAGSSGTRTVVPSSTTAMATALIAFRK